MDVGIFFTELHCWLYAHVVMLLIFCYLITIPRLAIKCCYCMLNERSQNQHVKEASKKLSAHLMEFSFKMTFLNLYILLEI